MADNTQNKDNSKVAYAVGQAHDLLRLLEEILSNDDDNLPENYLRLAKNLTYKLFAHCTTMLRLIQQEETYIPFAGKTNIDVASARALARVCIETYLTLFEVFFEHVDDDEILDFRLRIWLLKGFAPGALLRERIPYLLDEQTVVNYTNQSEQRKEEEECKQSILESDYFIKLQLKQRKVIEQKLRKSDYFSIKYADRTREELYSDAGLNKHILKYIFLSTSSFIHSDGYSAWEASTYNSHDVIRFEGFYLFTPIALIGKVIMHFASLSEHYREICAQQPDIFKLANDLTEEIKKDRAQDHAKS